MANNRFYVSAATLGNNVLFREIVDGKVMNRRMAWEPTIYLKCKKEDATHHSLFKDPAKAINPGTIYETKEFVKKYEGVENFDIFGQLNYTLQFLNEYPQGTPDFTLVPVRVIDIETRVPESGFPVPAKAEAEITLISCTDRITGKTVTFGSKPYEGDDTDFRYCSNELELLSKFLSWWESDYPVIVTGWNINGFDIGYLSNRILRIMGENAVKRLSPWGRVTIKEARHDPDLLDVEILGIECLDYLDLMRKFTYGERSSWSLGSVAQEELGTTKLDHSEFKGFNEFQDKGWDKFVRYNVIDVKLVFGLDKKMDLINLAMTLAYMARINFSDVYSPVKMWDAIIHNRLYQEGVVVPQRKSTGFSGAPIIGGYVKPPVPGLYHMGTSIDATSLYPSFMIHLNISPETFRGMENSSVDAILNGLKFDDLVERNLCIGANGALFDKTERGVIPKIIIEFMSDRKSAKNNMLKLQSEYEKTGDESLQAKIAAYDNLQMALKIAQNALYGGMSNAGFRFYNPDMAEAITSSGQLYLRKIEDNIDIKLSKKFNMPNLKTHIYTDTDSVYFTLKDVINKYCPDFPLDKKIKALEKLTKEKVVPEVNDICSDLDSIINVYESKISFKLEVAFDKAIFVAKKKYVARVHSSEGVTYAKPKIKVIGLEMVRSNTPTLVRERLAKVFDLIFDTDESTLQAYVEEIRQEFKTCDVGLIGRPTGTNSLDHSIDISRGVPKGLSINARAALFYNHEVKKRNLTEYYHTIKMGDKVKYVYLKMPNPIKNNVIAWPVDDDLPKEFGLDKFVDREGQFEKTFLSATEIILKAINWSPVKIDTLDDFFV